MNHTLYGLLAGFRHRKQLASILRSAAPGLRTVTVNPEVLKERGIKVLALDFDGVLAPHGRHEPLPEVTHWMRWCSACFGEGNIFILSNKPTPERSAWFSSHFPAIRFISGVRKKPYPDGLLQIIARSGSQAAEIMLLDDRLLTGALATCLARTQISYINNPYVDFRGNPVPELFFTALRSAEQLLFGLITGNGHEPGQS